MYIKQPATKLFRTNEIETKEIKAIPDANPSKPSIKLKALITDSINNKVKKDERIGLSANKKLKEISYPESNIKRLHEIIWVKNFILKFKLNLSSSIPIKNNKLKPIKNERIKFRFDNSKRNIESKALIPDISSNKPSSEVKGNVIDSKNVEKIMTPPPVNISDLWIFLLFGLSKILNLRKNLNARGVIIKDMRNDIKI